ncbi:MAG: glycosyltransferase, partial [Candidatus Eisenbacteria bacterium]|nr:glycosyltransferase [Candidatus Eisenbacteria bacterium]
MRVLHVLDFAPSHAGGLVTQLAHLATRLERAGGEMQCAFPVPRAWFDRLGPARRAIVLPQIRHPLRDGFASRLDRLLRQAPHDLVHLHFSFALPLALALAARRRLPPLVYHWHNPPHALLPPGTRPRTPG